MKLLIEHEHCDVCGRLRSTTIPFISEHGRGLFAPECPCGEAGDFTVMIPKGEAESVYEVLTDRLAKERNYSAETSTRFWESNERITELEKELSGKTGMLNAHIALNRELMEENQALLADVKRLLPVEVTRGLEDAKAGCVKELSGVTLHEEEAPENTGLRLAIGERDERITTLEDCINNLDAEVRKWRNEAGHADYERNKSETRCQSLEDTLNQIGMMTYGPLAYTAEFEEKVRELVRAATIEKIET